ncbi:hypothetical protein [Pedobacter westerhofensis]|uniref:hypothetical protein n=1 Tax=Pedobacter westerhofensis TaxID=425512 RepID=UPI001159C44A|nr:hypothetical protein [Pedobacter westerhofensis]
MKLTPLNIVTSACLVLALVMLFSPAQHAPLQNGVNGLLTGLCFLAAIIAFISDLIFRKFIPLLRNLWVVECAFIVFTLVLMVVLRITVE